MGANLYATAKTLGFDIDYKRLLKEFQSRGTLLRAFYYIAVIQDGAPDKRASLQNNRRCSRSRQTADALAGCGIVNVDEQGALRSAALEPPVLRSVDLDQLAHAIAAIPRLMHGPHPCSSFHRPTIIIHC